MTPLEHIRRNVFGITQTSMAEIASTTQATVSRWEKGDLEPDREQLELIRNEALRRGKEWEDRWFFELSGDEQPERSQ